MSVTVRLVTYSVYNLAPTKPIANLTKNCCRLMSWCVQYAKIAWCKYQDFMRTFNLSYYPTLKCSEFSFSFCVKYQAAKNFILRFSLWILETKSLILQPIHILNTQNHKVPKGFNLNWSIQVQNPTPQTTKLCYMMFQKNMYFWAFDGGGWYIFLIASFYFFRCFKIVFLL